MGADACDLYRDQIEQAVAGVDEEAVKRYGVTLQKAGELGLLMVDIPEKFGGLGGDLTTSCLVSEATARVGSWSVTHGAHVGIEEYLATKYVAVDL